MLIKVFKLNVDKEFLKYVNKYVKKVNIVYYYWMLKKESLLLLIFLIYVYIV